MDAILSTSFANMDYGLRYWADKLSGRVIRRVLMEWTQE